MKSEVLKSYKCIWVNGKQKRLHRHAMELHIGRPLRSDEIVHHIDGDKWNNNISNLKITNRSKHASHHYDRSIVRPKNGTMVKCCSCGKERYYPLSRVRAIRPEGKYKCLDCYKKYSVWPK